MPTKPLSHAERQRNRRDTQRASDERRRHSTTNKIHQDPRWRKVSKWYRLQHPLCEDPYGTHKRLGETQKADHVHHIIPLVVDPELAYNGDNLQSLCATCHNRVEAETRKGKR